MSPQQGAYVGLGSLVASFFGTFFVTPLYKSSFKEEDTWIDIYNELTLKMGGVESVEPEEAAQKAENGAILVDVRLARKFDVAAMTGSRNFPLYQPIEGWDLASNIRRAGFTFFGIFGTERNTEWLSDIEESIPKNAEIIVACELGGTLTPKNGADTGFQSQSLKAAFYLMRAGYKNVKHLKGGVAEYGRTVADLVPGEEVLGGTDPEAHKPEVAM